MVPGVVPSTALVEIARVTVGEVVGGGGGRLLPLRVKLSVTLLPTEPASSVA